jgi:hypothetical protein
MTQLNSNNLEQLKKQFANHPLFNRAEQMVSGKTSEEIEQIAKNLCQQRGINFDEAWKMFQQQFRF